MVRGGVPKRNCALHARDGRGRVGQEKMHGRRREAGYTPAHRTHVTGAGAWDKKMHGRRREAALPHVDEAATSPPDTCETDMQLTRTRHQASTR